MKLSIVEKPAGEVFLTVDGKNPIDPTEVIINKNVFKVVDCQEIKFKYNGVERTNKFHMIEIGTQIGTLKMDIMSMVRDGLIVHVRMYNGNMIVFPSKENNNG